MPSLVTYDPSKEQPRPRNGSRGFSTSSGAVMFDPNVPTPVADELLTELELIPDFKTLKQSGGIKIEPQAPQPEIVESQPADMIFNLPVPQTEMKAAATAATATPAPAPAPAPAPTPKQAKA